MAADRLKRQVGWAIVCGVFWRDVAFALWLTRDENADGPED
jgi:hypothetical protein